MLIPCSCIWRTSDSPFRFLGSTFLIVCTKLGTSTVCRYFVASIICEQTQLRHAFLFVFSVDSLADFFVDFTLFSSAAITSSLDEHGEPVWTKRVTVSNNKLWTEQLVQMPVLPYKDTVRVLWWIKPPVHQWNHWCEAVCWWGKWANPKSTKYVLPSFPLCASKSTGV